MQKKPIIRQAVSLCMSVLGVVNKCQLYQNPISIDRGFPTTCHSTTIGRSPLDLFVILNSASVLSAVNSAQILVCLIDSSQDFARHADALLSLRSFERICIFPQSQSLTSNNSSRCNI